MMSLYGWTVTLAGVGLAIIALINPILIAEVLGKANPSQGLRVLHRWLGRIFALGFLAFFVFMAPRAAYLGNFALYETLHATLGMILLPLVLAKFLCSFRYRNYINALGTLGLTIASLTFALVMLTSGHILMEVFLKL